MKLQITTIFPLDEIPGASGIARSGSDIFLIGDNSPFLFKLDENLKLVSKTSIYPSDQLIGNSIAKRFKPDFEALENINDNELIIYGSGSRSPERNYFKRIFLNDLADIKTYNIAAFYDGLRKLEILKNSELNIEAVTEYQRSIFLLNRRKNIIFSFSYHSFLDYLENHGPFPKIISTEFSLPKINGIEAGFSGATVAKKSAKIIFTASVENSPNAYDDGEILGSFIGILDIHKMRVSQVSSYALFNIGNSPIKVESVVIRHEVSKNEAELLVVADNDNDQSLLIKCVATW